MISEYNPRILEAFVNEIYPNKVAVTVECLFGIVRGVLSNVPFTNIMMLARPGKVPTSQEIFNEITTFIGGPCGHINPFLNTVLLHLGFDSGLVPGWMDGVLSHVAILVNIDGEDWWVDCGNGHPYMTPIKLESVHAQSHAGLTYSLKNNGDKYIVQHHYEHTDLPTENYQFKTTKVPFSFFDEMVKSHYTTRDFGPFLKGLRLVRFPKGEMVAIRDRELLTTEKGILTKSSLEKIDDLIECIKLYFPQCLPFLKPAMEVLRWS